MDITLSMEPEVVSFDTAEIFRESTDDYNDLKNKPTLNGTVIQGDIEEIDPTVPEWAKNESKPTYTPEEIDALNENNAITIEELQAMFA